MASFDTTAPSARVIEVLCLLKEHHNILISGPPATGKSHLLAELRYWFSEHAKRAKPGFAAKGRTAFPPTTPVTPVEQCMPGPDRTDHRVFPITFHQGTKYRDFIGGLSPRVVGAAGDPAFIVTRGALYEAAEHARAADGASLVEIDEINRGPAVAIFGDTITAIESTKRLLPNGTRGPMTSSFRLLNDDGTFRDYSLPHHLYIVAAMNEADTSVEPLDVAFLRRFKPYKLIPDESSLRGFLALPATKQALPATPGAHADVYEAAAQAWFKVNDRIELARGAAFQIGQGIFMEKPRNEVPTDLAGAQKFIADVWSKIHTHVTEVFFGDTRGAAAVLRAGEVGSPFTLEEKYFADTPALRLSGPAVVAPAEVYSLLVAVAGGD